MKIEEKEQKVRKQVKPDDKSYPHQNKPTTQKALILDTDTKENRPYRMIKVLGVQLPNKGMVTTGLG